MARPRKAPEEKRDKALNPRLTTAELAEIEANARALGITPGDFMRRCSLRYSLPATLAMQRQNAMLRTEFTRATVNLNQIARHLNAGGGRSAALERELQALIDRFNAELDRLYGPDDNGGRPQL